MKKMKKMKTINYKFKLPRPLVNKIDFYKEELKINKEMKEIENGI